MKTTAALAIAAVLAVLAGSALAHKPASPGKSPAAPGQQQTPASPTTPAGDNGNKPYNIPPAWGVTACQELKRSQQKNAFGQCIAATVHAANNSKLSPSAACKSLRPTHATKRSQRRAARAAYATCKSAVRKARRVAKSAGG